MRKRNGIIAASLCLAVVAAVAVGVLTGQDRPPSGDISIGLELVAEGLTSPVGLAPSPDGSGRLFIVDQVGVIRVLTAEGVLLDPPFLDLRDRMVTLNPGFDERGLLGLAFHPSFADNGRFFVYYSAPLRSGAPSGWDHTSHISEFRAQPSSTNVADPASERIILQVDEPQSNHNAGQITFGPDGYLYIALGDGGAANDTGPGHPPMGNGQDITTLLGSILRIDVDGGEPYGIPADNPFVGREGRNEIYAFGFRNPFRISFDSGGARELFVADVGQGMWEEVDIVTGGANYGWNIKEGDHCFDPDDPQHSPEQCPDTDAAGDALVAPIIEYRNAATGGIGTAVIGGFIYRGEAIPALHGRYIFGDFAGEELGLLFMGSPPAEPGQAWSMDELKVNTSSNGRLNAYLRSFGQDQEGEIYALVAGVPGPAGATGKVYRLAP